MANLKEYRGPILFLFIERMMTIINHRLKERYDIETIRALEAIALGVLLIVMV